MVDVFVWMLVCYYFSTFHLRFVPHYSTVEFSFNHRTLLSPAIAQCECEFWCCCSSLEATSIQRQQLEFRANDCVGLISSFTPVYVVVHFFFFCFWFTVHLVNIMMRLFLCIHTHQHMDIGYICKQ